MIGYLKERITGGGRRKVTRAQIIGAQPVRNPAVQWERAPYEDDGPSVALLRVPRRRDRWGDMVARLFRLPDFRKLELDEIGSDVWEMCDGSHTVDAVTRAICAKYRLNRRQGETSVTAYLKQLAERRLVGLRTGAKTTGGKRVAPTMAAKNRAAVAAARKQKQASIANGAKRVQQ